MIDKFVNGNAVNVTVLNTNSLETVQEEFESKLTYDSVNDEAFPVLVYVRNNEFVAWCDLENAQGYVNEQLTLH